MGISVVMSEAALKDKIFNALALQFVLDLDDQFFKIMQDFNLKAEKEKVNKDEKEGGKPDKRDAWCQGVVVVLVGAVSIHQATKMLYAIHTGWLPATLMFCTFFSHSPSFL